MIDKQHKEDINIPNGPFCLFGKCFPNTTIRYPSCREHTDALSRSYQIQILLSARKKAVNGEIYSRQRLFCYSFLSSVCDADALCCFN